MQNPDHDQIADSGSPMRRARRVVIKIGSSLLVDANTGQLDHHWLDALAAEVGVLVGRGQQPVLVSSGAIALGRKYLGLGPEQRRLEQQQAAAAAGQVLLAHAYQEALGRHGLKVAQMLLTLGDTESRPRYLNARNTLETLIAAGAIAVINENDSVATEEIRYGDNDRLAARVAVMCSAECLVLLSDVDGLYDADPATSDSARLVRRIDTITPEIEALAGSSRTAFGTGGMKTKLEAARICMTAGCAAAITNGRRANPISSLDQDSRCTWFMPATSTRLARKRWIAGSLEPCGSVTIDAGAEQSLRAGKSLLPVGIVAVEGEFRRGDAVRIRGRDGRDLGCGLAGYAGSEVRQLIGRRSDEIEAILGYRDRDEVIHRDNMALNNL